MAVSTAGSRWRRLGARRAMEIHLKRLRRAGDHSRLRKKAFRTLLLGVTLRLACGEAAAERGYFRLPLGAEGENQHLLIDLLVLGQAAPLAATCRRHILIRALGFAIETGHRSVPRRRLTNHPVILLDKTLVLLDSHVHRIENSIFSAQLADFVECGFLVLIERRSVTN